MSCSIVPRAGGSQAPSYRLRAMSYDLVFWTDARPDRPDPQSTYRDLIDGATVEGLGPFNAQAVLDALSDQFAGLAAHAGNAGYTVWEGPNNETVFEFNWSPQYLMVTARGNYTNEQMNVIIDVGTQVGGGSLYDPQTGERFNGQ